MMDLDDQITFLHYGYIPQVNSDMRTLLLKLRRPDQVRLADSGVEQLIEEGVAHLRAAVHNCDVGDQNVVPLSGGLDSRAILGCLIDMLPDRALTAVTIGTPGTWDYELGAQVATAASVSHVQIDLRNAEWSVDTLIAHIRSVPSVVSPFDSWLFHQTREPLGVDPVYWSGFLGEALSGAHLPRVPSTTWDGALRNFARSQQMSRNVRLTPSGFSPERSIRMQPIPDSWIGLDDQLDLGVRQGSYIGPIITLPGYNYRTPFADADWMRFMLGVPESLRMNQSLYKRILHRAFPSVFVHPVKNNLGLSVTASPFRVRLRSRRMRLVGKLRSHMRHAKPIDPSVNYIDYTAALRADCSLSKLVYQCLRDLDEREQLTWISVQSIWEQHSSGVRDYSRALLLLAALELRLKARA